jgi:hypothetical protein
VGGQSTGVPVGDVEVDPAVVEVERGPELVVPGPDGLPPLPVASGSTTASPPHAPAVTAVVATVTTRGSASVRFIPEG